MTFRWSLGLIFLSLSACVAYPSFHKSQEECSSPFVGQNIMSSKSIDGTGKEDFTVEVLGGTAPGGYFLFGEVYTFRITTDVPKRLLVDVTAGSIQDASDGYSDCDGKRFYSDSLQKVHSFTWRADNDAQVDLTYAWAPSYGAVRVVSDTYENFAPVSRSIGSFQSSDSFQLQEDEHDHGDGAHTHDDDADTHDDELVDGADEYMGDGEYMQDENESTSASSAASVSASLTASVSASSAASVSASLSASVSASSSASRSISMTASSSITMSISVSISVSKTSFPRPSTSSTASMSISATSSVTSAPSASSSVSMAPSASSSEGYVTYFSASPSNSPPVDLWVTTDLANLAGYSDDDFDTEWWAQGTANALGESVTVEDVDVIFVRDVSTQSINHQLQRVGADLRTIARTPKHSRKKLLEADSSVEIEFTITSTSEEDAMAVEDAMVDPQFEEVLAVELTALGGSVEASDLIIDDPTTEIIHYYAPSASASPVAESDDLDFSQGDTTVNVYIGENQM